MSYLFTDRNSTFRHTDLGVWSCDASDLGLRPGQWPDCFRTTLANGQQVTAGPRKLKVDSEGELLYIDYPATGVTLRVYND